MTSRDMWLLFSTFPLLHTTAADDAGNSWLNTPTEGKGLDQEIDAASICLYAIGGVVMLASLVLMALMLVDIIEYKRIMKKLDPTMKKKMAKMLETVTKKELQGKQ